jgi:transposase
MNRAALALPVDDEDRHILEQWARSSAVPHRVVIRAQGLLLAQDGVANSRIATALGVSRPTVLDWRRRFLEDGLDSVVEIRAGRGRKPAISARKVKAIVQATLHRTPPGATHWSCRTMAKAQGVSHATVQRIWDAHGLQPHRATTFKLSTDPAFVEKLTDIVGLYMNPPEKAVVLCVDEKSQIQALDRTQPGLPMKKGRCGTFTHDYKRHGTTTLFAALSMLDGTVIGECHGRHRHQEFLKFLRQLDRAFPRRLHLHLILDNYGTHKHPIVHAWLAAHPRFTLHFTPTGASWLNLVESWFSQLTQTRLRRGVFRSVPELVAAIEAYLQHYNTHPTPFAWTATVDAILEKVGKCKIILETHH